MERYEAFVLSEVQTGRGIIGLYPCTTVESEERYAEWRRAETQPG